MKIRKRIRVYGIVQGVGFRPFVSRIAREYDIFGTVCNKGSYVEILAQGEEELVRGFLHALEHEAPPRSVIVKIKLRDLDVIPEIQEGDGSDACNGRFNIIESVKEEGLVFVSPDIATCPDCRRELFDPRDRRYLHPFINCTACGPRLTILDSMPYDRIRTSMGAFSMCPACEHEYTHAETRRYHAQPVCCNDCGPELYLLDGTGSGRKADGRDEEDPREAAEDQKAASDRRTRNEEAILRVRQVLREGGIAAIKGIGGFHLACDATNEAAVRRLRELKHRPVKPFAVMMKELDTVKRECIVLPGEEAILTGPQKPIILLERRAKDTGIAETAGGASDPSGLPEIREIVAPGNPCLGVMLPYAPVQMLLFDYPPDPEPVSDCFVMTSGNPSGAPIAMNDEEAIRYLSPMCDVILSNPREIRIRADDTVMAFYKGAPYMIRRSRGYAPLPVTGREEIPHAVLGIGGELKNTFCLARSDLYYHSPYIGDMADLRSVHALEAATERLERLLEITPEAIICDLHPKYNTGAVAAAMSEARGIPRLEVQHHYAHIASCLAENEQDGPVIGVSFDGTGYGTDGSIWGGEFLLADLDGFCRLGSIEPFRHAGGDLASKEGWRIAVSLLEEEQDENGIPLPDALGLGTEQGRNAVRFLLRNHVNTVKSTSAGRIFDAVSAILGIAEENTFEGEASMALQFAAERAASGACSGGEIRLTRLLEPAEDETFLDGRGFRLQTTALVRALAKRRLEAYRESGESGEQKLRELLALSFHETLAEMILAGCLASRERTGIDTAALSGGVFQNLLLLRLTEEKLADHGFTVLRHSLVPPNDGGIALGQAAVGMRRLRNEG